MNRTPISLWGHFWRWLAVTSLGVAVGMGVSALWHRFIQESTRGPNEGHILLLTIITTSTVIYILLLWGAKSRRGL